MNKKRINREQLFVLTAGAVCFAFMAFVVMVFPAVKLSGLDLKVDGIQAIFGGETDKGLKFNFNIILLIGYLLPLVAVVTGIYAYRSDKILLDIITISCVLVGAIIMALEPTLFKLFNEIPANVKASYAAGPIFGMVCSAISLIFSIGCLRTKLN